MFDLQQNYAISRKLASQGMVLLKNEEQLLPFQNQASIGIIGNENLELIKGGGGSSQVNCLYIKNLLDGLYEKEQEGKILLSAASVERARDTNAYTTEELNQLADEMDTAIVTIKRWGSEGCDRLLSRERGTLCHTDYAGEDSEHPVTGDYEKIVGYFMPSRSEIDLLTALEVSRIKQVVVILNISATVELSFLQCFSKVKAILLTYLPGMESGTAIADILCGDVNPSGKLVDTIAYNYEDYPSSLYFDYHPEYTEYKEGIFVGYRYFETFAKDKVLYPFGFGLSYTEFELRGHRMDILGDFIAVYVTVTNTGHVAGREVVQVYSSSPAGLLEKPVLELRGFAKTKELQPGESTEISVTFPLDRMASFDETGLTGFKAAWVLEKGDYTIVAGNSVRNTACCGIYTVSETFVTEQLSLRFDGSPYMDKDENPAKPAFGVKKGLSLQDVADHTCSLQEFIEQLDPEELIHLAQGQMPSFPLGTAGIGNLPQYGVPNPQTADGPSGIRRSVNTTSFPCGTLIAASWDQELQYAMGKAMGFEGISTGIDILLGPSMNIHRNPLCGRNFEYLSEDPLVTGQTATAIVNGVQSQGLCATLKHFAANNCEYERRDNSSNVSERALREIYLKGFEIAVKESHPDFIMTSYNKINGIHASAHRQLLTGVLRDEWGFEGAVMTDWRNHAPLDEEIIAGNNIKMPFGYPDQAELALRSYKNQTLSMAHLQRNAADVLKAVMKTGCFRKKDFGIRHVLHDGVNKISAIDVNGISNTRTRQGQREDGTHYLYSLGKDKRAQRTFVVYSVLAPYEGDYRITAQVSTNCPESQIWIFNGNEKSAVMSCGCAVDEQLWYTLQTDLHLFQGENLLKFVFANEPFTEYDYSAASLPEPEEDIRFADLQIILSF